VTTFFYAMLLCFHKSPPKKVVVSTVQQLLSNGSTKNDRSQIMAVKQKRRKGALVARDATIEVCRTVFSLRSAPRLHNEEQLRLRESSWGGSEEKSVRSL
jgi:hypothetical protein